MQPTFIDTHAHIHFKNYPFDADTTWKDAEKAGVSHMLAVGVDVESSLSAVAFAKNHENVFAAIGIHPHEATKFLADKHQSVQFEELLDNAAQNKIAAIGEFGLDYFYEHSSKLDQIEVLRYQLGLLHRYDLPACFHVRDAFADFWPVFDEYHAQKPIRGVMHCFTAGPKLLKQALKRDLYIALNGIITFTKDQAQLETAKSVPVNRLLLETDAPYLTPMQFRGNICKPEYVMLTAQFLADLREESIETLSEVTSKNFFVLFGAK